MPAVVYLKGETYCGHCGEKVPPIRKGRLIYQVARCPQCGGPTRKHPRTSELRQRFLRLAPKRGIVLAGAF